MKRIYNLLSCKMPSSEPSKCISKSSPIKKKLIKCGLTFLLFFLVGFQSAFAHAVQVGYAVLSNGFIRVYIEHWHGDQTTASLVNNGMSITSTYGTSTVTQNVNPTGAFNNTAWNNLPGAGANIIILSKSSSANGYNDWAYYDFAPAACNVPVKITLNGGISVVLEESESQIWPQTITGTFNDTAGPTITPANTSTTVACGTPGANVNFSATAVDNCTSNPTVNFSIAPGSFFPVGTTNVIAYSSDANGNSTQLTFPVVVNVIDNTPPVFASVAPMILNNELNKCGAIVSYPMPSASDDCSGNYKQKVLLIWDEINSNTTNLKNALTAAGLDVTLSATSEIGYDGSNPSLSNFDAVIHLNGTTYNTAMPISGQNALVDFVINKGKTYITDEWSAYEVDDMRTMTAMKDIVVLNRTSGLAGNYTYNVVSAQAGHPILNGLPASFTLPYGGSNIGGARTYTSNQPVVLMNSENGVAVAVRNFSNNGKAIGFQHAGNYWESTILSDLNVQKLYINAVKYGNPGGVTVNQTAGLASGSLFPIGTTTNTFVATDAAGNKSTYSFNIKVTDAQKPTVLTKNITINLDANGTATITAADVNNGSTDNCPIPATGYSLNQTAFNCEDIGKEIQVTLTVTDASGNVNSEVAKVKVTDPNSYCNSAPIAKAKALILSADDNCQATTSAESFNDGSTDPDGDALTFSVAPVGPYAIGVTNVVLTVTDTKGASSTSDVTVTVVDDTKPSITSAGSVTKTADVGACGAIITLATPAISDNCGIKSVSNDAPVNGFFPVGVTMVTWTVSDIHGLTATTIQVVTVTDNEKPIVKASEDKFFCYAPSYTISALTFTDNCGVASVTFAVTGATSRIGSGEDASGEFEVGESTITWTVTDLHGNVSTASTKITVNAPVSVAIADASALGYGVSKNTIYPGYGPASSLTLTAAPSGGTAGYTYSWNTGATAASIIVTTAGTYTVTITDSKGCTATVSKEVKAVNVACTSGNSGKLDKVLVCHNGQSICIAPDAVQAHLQHGCTLGSCSAKGVANARAITNVKIENSLGITVYPNPLSNRSTVEFTLVNAGKYSLEVYDAKGALVKVIDKGTGEANKFNSYELDAITYSSGIYLVKLSTDKEVVTKRIVVQK